MLTAKDGEQYKWRRVCAVDVSAASAVSEVELPWVSYTLLWESLCVCVCVWEREKIYPCIFACVFLSASVEGVNTCQYSFTFLQKRILDV